MASFYIGQRVRVVGAHAPSGARNVGKEAVVNELDCEAANGDTGLIGVTIDGDPEFCYFASELEPIILEGHKVVEWSECLWQPSDILEREEA